MDKSATGNRWRIAAAGVLIAGGSGRGVCLERLPHPVDHGLRMVDTAGHLYLRARDPYARRRVLRGWSVDEARGPAARGRRGRPLLRPRHHPRRSGERTHLPARAGVRPARRHRPRARLHRAAGDAHPVVPGPEGHDHGAGRRRVRRGRARHGAGRAAADQCPSASLQRSPSSARRTWP